VAPIGNGSLRLEADEQRLWKEARELQERLNRSGLICQDPAVQAYINQVTVRLVPENVRTELEVEVKVLRHPAVNAFSLPNGVVYIHTGFLARMENEAQLAAVLGHEVSHVIYRHALLGFRNIKQAAAVATTIAVIGAPAGLYGLAPVTLGTLGALAAVSGYSQSLEQEADSNGLALMAQAGYDPNEAVTVMQNIERHIEREKIAEPFFFSTHPRLEERKASYQHLLSSEYRSRSGGFKGKEEFEEEMADVFLDDALLELARGRFAFAQDTFEKYLLIRPQNARAHFALAELLQQRGAQGDQEKAEGEYHLAIDLDPSLAEPHRGLGVLFYKRGQMNLARECFDRYLALNPEAKDRAYIEQYLEAIAKKGAAP
jgi:predicted Zn-dependent protease